jgi:hypothetical protein
MFPFGYEFKEYAPVSDPAAKARKSPQFLEVALKWILLHLP